MNTTVKLLCAVLVSMLLAACGSGGGGKSTDNTSINGNNILSNYLTETFPPFDDTPYRDKIVGSMRVANYIQISQSDAQSFYDTLTKEKNFVIEGERVFGVDHRMYFSPNFDFKSQGYDELYGSICYAGIWGSAWESCNLRSMYSRNESVSGYIIRLTMAHQNNSLPVTTEAYFDEVFGHPNGAPDWELFSVVYENANMTAEINSYYEKIEASGVFDEGDAVYQAAMNTSG